MKNPVLKALFFVVMLVAFGAGVGMYSSSYYTGKLNATPEIRGFLWPNPKPLRPFASIDHKGDIFGLENFQGKWTFIFFGYTHCPDICPVTMTILNQLDQQLGDFESPESIQMAFMTVDPDRDTSEKLADYINYFNKDFIALGGNMSQIESLTRQIGVPHIIDENQESEDYLVDHSASIFLIDPKGRFSAIFSAPHDVSDIRDRFKAIHRFISKQES